MNSPVTPSRYAAAPMTGYCAVGLRFLDLPKTVFAIAFLTLLYGLKLTDPDYYWHLKTGELIVTSGFPEGDPFSHTFDGKPWVLHEWLFQVMLWSVFAVAGALGVKALVSGLGVATAWITYSTVRRIVPTPIVGLGLAVILLLLGASGISARPQMISYVLFAAFVHVLLKLKYCRTDPSWALMPLLMVLWVNCHGGYVIGLALAVLFTGLEWINYRLARTPDPDRRARLVRLTLVVLLTLMASAVNPDGFERWLYPFQVLGMDFAMTVIQEWHSPNFAELHNQLFLVMVFGFLVLLAYRRTPPDCTEILLPVFFSFAAFVSYRHVPLAMLMLIPFTAVALRESPLLDMYARRIAGGKQLGTVELALNWTLLLAVGLVVVVTYPSRQAEIMRHLDSRLPVGAADYIKTSGLSGRMFNDYTFGGYLIYSLYPAQRVFIDGRADVYGDEFLKDYVTIARGAPGWQNAFDRHRIDYVVIRRASPLHQLLLLRGDFVPAYEDAYNAILVQAGHAISRRADRARGEGASK